MTSRSYLALISAIALSACDRTSTQSPRDVSRPPDNGAPISGSLRISDVMFTDPRDLTKPHSNVYNRSLHGFMRVLIEAYGARKDEIFDLAIEWSLKDATGTVIHSDHLHIKSPRPNTQLWADIPLRAQLLPKTYLLTAVFFEKRRKETLTLRQELIITDEL